MNVSMNKIIELMLIGMARNLPIQLSLTITAVVMLSIYSFLLLPVD